MKSFPGGVALPLPVHPTMTARAKGGSSGCSIEWVRPKEQVKKCVGHRPFVVRRHGGAGEDQGDRR
eukprot:scaffold1347_cov350-Pavlova_lutheri.AAC.31